MFLANFVYNEPGVGDITVDDATPWDHEDIIKLIEEKFPSYVDIEITSVEELD